MQQKVKNVKMKTDENKLHFEIEMAVVAGNVADVLMLFGRDHEVLHNLLEIKSY